MGSSVRDGTRRRLMPSPAQSAAQAAFLFLRRSSVTVLLCPPASGTRVYAAAAAAQRRVNSVSSLLTRHAAAWGIRPVSVSGCYL